MKDMSHGATVFWSCYGVPYCIHLLSFEIVNYKCKYRVGLETIQNNCYYFVSIILVIIHASDINVFDIIHIATFHC